MDQRQFFLVIGTLSFQAADRFFKFASWAAIVIALGYAETVTQSRTMHVVHTIAYVLYVWAILFQGFYMLAKNPEDWGFPQDYLVYVKAVQLAVAVALLASVLIPMPNGVLDTIFSDLANAHPHAEVVKP